MGLFKCDLIPMAYPRQSCDCHCILKKNENPEMREFTWGF